MEINGFPQQFNPNKRLKLYRSTPIDLLQMPNLNSLLFFNSNITKQEILLSQPLKSLYFEDCIHLTDIYLYSTINEFIMIENKVVASIYAVRKIIGRGIPIPKVRVFVNGKFCGRECERILNEFLRGLSPQNASIMMRLSKCTYSDLACALPSINRIITDM